MIISRLYAMIGMRYHSNIFAAKAGVPFIAVTYEEKMAGFMHEWNLDEWEVKLENLSYENLLDKYEKLKEQYTIYKEMLLEHHTLWKRHAEETMESIMEWM